MVFVKMYIEGGDLKTLRCFTWDTKLLQLDQKITILTNYLLERLKVILSYLVIQRNLLIFHYVWFWDKHYFGTLKRLNGKPKKFFLTIIRSLKIMTIMFLNMYLYIHSIMLIWFHECSIIFTKMLKHFNLWCPMKHSSGQNKTQKLFSDKLY